MATVQLMEAGGKVYLNMIIMIVRVLSRRPGLSFNENVDDDEPFLKQASRKQGLSVKTEGGKEEMGAQAQVISNRDDHDAYNDHHGHNNHNDEF